MYTFDGCNLSAKCSPIFAADDRLLICGSSDGYLYFWDTFKGADQTLCTDMDGGNHVVRAKVHNFPIQCITKSENGNYLSCILYITDVLIATSDQSGKILLHTAESKFDSAFPYTTQKRSRANRHFRRRKRQRITALSEDSSTGLETLPLSCYQHPPQDERVRSL